MYVFVNKIYKIAKINIVIIFVLQYAIFLYYIYNYRNYSAFFIICYQTIDIFYFYTIISVSAFSYLNYVISHILLRTYHLQKGYYNGTDKMRKCPQSVRNGQ